ncbi:hypothetical protein [Ancylobacter sp.]|uniref:hypothetical protein n=1 Tax=Ancylobacter sp. TaxID=1872567 RepID=UPI003BADA888
MVMRTTLIFDDECVACSALAQFIGARAPDMARVSVYSPRAQILLRRHFPQGWAIRPYLILGEGENERVLSGTALLFRVARLLGPAGMVKAAQALLRRARREKARGGWAANPTAQMRAYIPASPAEAAAFAGEPLLLPAAQPGLGFERILQWYNLHGAFQTASYWIHGTTGTLVLEQVHRSSPPPAVEGRVGEAVVLAEGRTALLHVANAADGATALTLIVPLPAERWLSLRATGMDRATLLSLARGCVPVAA